MKANLIYISSSSNISGVPLHILHLVKSLKSKYNIIVITPQGWLKDQLDKQDIEVITLSPKLSKFAKFKKVLERFNNSNSIIHSHGAKASLVSRIVTKKYDAKIVYTEHNWTKDYRLNQRWREPIQIYFLKTLAKVTDKIICVSKSVQNFYISKNISEQNKLQLIYNGVEFTDIKQQVDKNKKLTIGTIGTLDKRKRVEILIRTFAAICDQDQKLMIMGDGPMRQSLEIMCHELGISEQVIFMGFQEDTKKFWNNIDIYVQTSRDESFGMSIAEAIGNQIPSLGSNVGALPELLDKKYLFEDMDDLQSKLSKMIDNIDIESKSSIEKSKTFREKFGIPRFAREHDEMYQHLLET